MVIELEDGDGCRRITSLAYHPVLEEVFGAGPMRKGHVLLFHSIALQIATAVRVERTAENDVVACGTT